MNGIRRMTHVVQADYAWQDWRFVVLKLREAGRTDLVEAYCPPEGAGARKVDEAIARVRAEMGWPPVWVMRAADNIGHGTESEG